MNKKKRIKSSINITKVLWIVSTRSNTFLTCFKASIVELIWVWSEMICKKSSASWYWMLHPNSIRTPMTIEKLHAFSLFRVIRWTLNLLIWFILEFKQFFYKWCKCVKEFSLKNRNGKIKLSMSVLWHFNIRFLLNDFILVFFYNVTLFGLRIEFFLSIMTSLLISFLSWILLCLKWTFCSLIVAFYNWTIDSLHSSTQLSTWFIVPEFTRKLIVAWTWCICPIIEELSLGTLETTY